MASAYLSVALEDELPYGDFTTIMYPERNTVLLYDSDKKYYTYNGEKAYGFLQCRVVCPKNEEFPLLTFKFPENSFCSLKGRNVGPNCYTCAQKRNLFTCTHTKHQRAFDGTWVLEEINEAILDGYEIV